MKLRELLTPPLFKRINHRLLVDFLLVWETRFIHFAYYGVLLGLAMGLIAWFYPFNFPQIPSPRIFYFSVLVLFFLTFIYFILYLQRQNKRKKDVFSLAEIYQLVGIYTFNAVVTFSIPFLCYFLIYQNAHSKIEWEEMDYFEQALGLYSSRILDAQVDVYSRATGKTKGQILYPSRTPQMDRNVFKEEAIAEEVRNILKKRYQTQPTYVQERLNATIDAIDFTQVLYRNNLNAEAAMANPVLRSTIDASLPYSNKKWQADIDTYGSSDAAAIAYVKTTFEKVEKEYNRSGTDPQLITILLITIFLIYLAVNWLLLSRGHEPDSTEFVTLIFLTLAGFLILLFGEYIFHTIAQGAEHIKGLFVTPFLLFIGLLAFTYARRQYANNNLSFTVTALSLVFLCPILFYNILSDDIELIFSGAITWIDALPFPLIALVLLIVLLTIVHSLLIYNRINTRPKY